MIGFFEVISISAPHIYHSALPQSPQTSAVRKLYEPYARPLARVVWGIPISWEPAVATVRHRGGISVSTWSPCSRYIAVSYDDPPTINILDAATLEQLHTFEPWKPFGWLSFSSDSRLLTQFSGDHEEVTTWDLQTGGRISTIPPALYMCSECFSSTYSIDGKMVAVAYREQFNETTGISTYNLLSGTRMYSHHVSEAERVVASIWTHGECLRFVTLKPGTITVWQVGFASIDTLAKVESFPTPTDIDYLGGMLFLPTRFLFAFAGLGIWDVRDSKFLLKIQNRDPFSTMSISSDGRFFAYQARDTGIDIWEESPAGYVHRRKLESGFSLYSSALLSPNGKSIITSQSCETKLWRTTDSIAFPSSVPTEPIPSQDFLLDSSPGGSFAVTARRKDSMVTVVDLKSGNPRLIIDTGMEIYGLWVTGNTITVFDGRRIVAWKLPGGDHVLDTKVTIDDSVRTITLDPPIPNSRWRKTTAISRHLNCVVTFSWGIEEPGYHLDIHDMSTGNHLVGVITQKVHTLWITPDGCGVRFLAPEGHVGGWEIVGGEGSGVVGLEPLLDNMCSSGGNPLESPHGHRVADDGWIFNSRKERLMWLPHRWRGYKEGRKWDGRFLGLLHGQLPEPIIIEFDE